ncbi:MAG TPA: hypothetical protein VHJ99_11680 [Candidatus Dormibacteraeota bacterium]|nr:hypothetical protein [Candidatus Dormibacteraeota bacterium]
MVVEAATIALSLIHFATNSTHHFMVCQQDYKAVQAGLDGSMAYYNLDTVPLSSGTNDMTSPVLPAIARGPSSVIPPGCIAFPAASVNKR